MDHSDYKNALASQAKSHTRLAELDADEGERRDQYAWRRDREPISVRIALKCEYDGVRRRAGLAVKNKKHLVTIVIIEEKNDHLRRFFAPLVGDLPNDITDSSAAILRTFTPSQWLAGAQSGQQWRSDKDRIVIDLIKKEGDAS